MEPIKGVRSVDFLVQAAGHGVVNWNGPTTLTGNDGKTVDNHTLPKLRGYTNLTGRIKDDTGYKYKKEPTDIDFKQNPLYISQNCVRHHLFRDQAFDLHYANERNLLDVLTSLTGLVRGYVVPASQSRRASPLLLEDFVDQLGNGNFEQFGQAGERDDSSFFSKTTFGDTRYLSHGSISMEQLQFISLDRKFDRAAMDIDDGEGPEIAKSIEDFLQRLDKSLQPEAEFHANWVRKGAIYGIGEAGLLLNQDAQEVLVRATLSRIEELMIRQAKGYMYVEEVTVDYNDSSQMMRIKRDPSTIAEERQSDYAIYYEKRE